jgi:UDP-N-acetylmuramoyl-L-alanyl-D-glutamate--2,6-diaminopimelate ligase
MGRTAARLSDLASVTSDNPRTEDPLDILAQVRGGMISPPFKPQRVLQGEGQGGGGFREYRIDELSNGFFEKGFVMLENRRAAIRLAIRLARPGDIVLLAGKGHEDYQIIGRTKHHFDDREEAAQAFAELDG